MYLTEKTRTLEPYEIEELKRMDDRYGEFRGTQYRQSRNDDWIEIDFGYSPADSIKVSTTIRVDTDTISATVKVLRGSRTLYERSSGGSSLSKYGVLRAVIRNFLQNLSDLLRDAYEESYFICHTSTGNDPMYSDYWELMNLDYLDKRVDRLKKSVARLNRYIDRF